MERLQISMKNVNGEFADVRSECAALRMEMRKQEVDLQSAWRSILDLIKARDKALEQQQGISTEPETFHQPADSVADLKPYVSFCNLVLHRRLENHKRFAMNVGTEHIKWGLICRANRFAHDGNVLGDAALYFAHGGDQAERGMEELPVFFAFYAISPEEAQKLARASTEIRLILCDRGTVVQDGHLEPKDTTVYLNMVDQCVTDFGNIHRKVGDVDLFSRGQVLSKNYQAIIAEYRRLRKMAVSRYKQTLKDSGGSLETTSACVDNPWEDDEETS